MGTTFIAALIATTFTTMFTTTFTTSLLMPHGSPSSFGGKCVSTNHRLASIARSFKSSTGCFNLGFPFVLCSFHGCCTGIPD